MNPLKAIFWKAFTSIDGALKFPHLQAGELGIQLGFDMTAPVTSDLFTMYKRVSPGGKVIGIDPDPFNHEVAGKLIQEKNWNIQLVQKGTFSRKDSAQFLLGKKSSWNQLDTVPIDSTVEFSNESITVEINTLDQILADESIDPNSIRHINLTINGAEYDTLLGMENLLKNATDLSLTIISGRHDESGTIQGKQDYEMILPLLESYGFSTKFKRINQLFWWGFMVKFFINRKWIYNQPNFGIIMAGKGKNKPVWYQSFS
jgi:FkbM family methyltransferase